MTREGRVRVASGARHRPVMHRSTKRRANVDSTQRGARILPPYPQACCNPTRLSTSAFPPSGGPVVAQVDVRLERVTKRFHEVTAVDDLSLDITRGEFFSMLGPSGCGKTTTLRMIGGFELPTAGTIRLGDRDVTDLPPFRRDVNTVFQNYALFPHLNVFENVAFGLRRRKVDAAEIAKQVGAMLELVELPGYERRRPNQLSGGQQQRVA